MHSTPQPPFLFLEEPF